MVPYHHPLICLHGMALWHMGFTLIEQKSQPIFTITVIGRMTKSAVFMSLNKIKSLDRNYGV
jgi:hypothetical protein